MDVSALDEFSLIARLTASLSGMQHGVALGVGDDCAVLELTEEQVLLATCDSQVEDVHFTLQTASPEQIGRKALAVNISDIAAMGGMPRYALVSLVLPRQMPLELLEGIYAGLRQESERFAVAIVGGNIAGAGTGPALVIDITLLGTSRRQQVLTRRGARVGDVLCVTGHPGDSAAGLYTLLHPDRSYSAAALTHVQQAHRTPQPRVEEGKVLAQFGPAIVTALLDISDGLSGDLGHICECSQVGARIELARLPFSSAMITIASEAGQEPLSWTLHGGEDYELLFTVSPDYVEQVCELVQTQTGTPVTRIGCILPEESGLELLWPDGRKEALRIKSWKHLAQ